MKARREIDPEVQQEIDEFFVFVVRLLWWLAISFVAVIAAYWIWPNGGTWAAMFCTAVSMISLVLVLRKLP